MTRRALIVVFFTLAVLSRDADARTHDVFRFVGNVIKWDARKNALDVKTRETWDGKESDYIRHIVLRNECVVRRHSKTVSRSELKPGVFVVVDAAGVDINDLEGTAIEIIPVPPPNKKPR